MAVNWESVRFFRALAVAGSLERAARKLGVGISTVHRRVGRLEEELGVRLFVRGKGGHELTDAGETLLEQADEIDERLTEVSHRIGGRDEQLEGTVRVATTQAAADYILLPKVAELRATHPSIRVELESLPEIVSLIDPRPSIALRFIMPDRGDVTVRRLSQLSCGLFAAKAVDPNDIADADHIGWTQQFRHIGLSKRATSLFNRPAVLALGSMNGHLEAARAGLGVAHLPDFVARHAPDLVRVSERPTMHLDAWLVIPRAIRHIRRVDVAARFVADAVAAVS